MSLTTKLLTTSVEVLRQTRNLEPSEVSAIASTTEAEHDTSQSTSKKTLKRDSWSNNQTGALINAWKNNLMKLRHIDSQVHD